MNDIHERRRLDFAMLQRALDLEELKENVRLAFEDMLMQLATEAEPDPHRPPPRYKRYVRYVLSDNMRAWVQRELDRADGLVTNGWVTAGPVPRGREVEMAPVLRQPLPKRPPGKAM